MDVVGKHQYDPTHGHAAGPQAPSGRPDRRRDFIYHPLEEEPEEAREESEPAEYQEEAFGEIRRAVHLIRSLPEAGIHTYAVLGNHHYGMEVPTSPKLPWLADRVREALQATGVQVLQNEAVPRAPPRAGGQRDHGAGPPPYLVGIGPHDPHEDRTSVTLAQVPEGSPRLNLMHHPNTFA